MNNFLAIDSASSHLTVLAAKGDKKILRYSADCALRHSVVIMDEIDAAMSQASLAPAECDFFCAVTGPGSFTGIRIGISAAKGMSLATGKPLLPLTAFELVAYNVKAESFAVVIDAAHDCFYAQPFFGGEAGEPLYITRERLVALGLDMYGYQPIDLPRYTRLDAGECLFRAVERKVESGYGFGDMHALYVRKSQAEEGRK